MHNCSQHTISVLVMLSLALGCATSATHVQPVGGANGNEQKSNLTPAVVKSKIVKGATTQNDVLTIFGAPNIITRDTDGFEVWTYDVQYLASASDLSTSSVGGTLVVGGVGTSEPVGGVAGVGGSRERVSSRNQVTSATFTLMITFGSDEVVKDYRMMSTRF